MKVWCVKGTVTVLLALSACAGVFAMSRRKSLDADSWEQEIGGVTITNSYENSEELKKSFPVIYPTPVRGKLAKNIENRLLTGFANWNRGFDGWKAWGTVLYTDDSIYNVHGARLTLAEYQAAMDVALKQADIRMGDFQNILICDDWAAIRYATSTIAPDGTETPGGVMEFVKFKDYGRELGTRVEEVWGGTRGAGFAAMSRFQTEAERETQRQVDARLLAYELPDTADLEKKYPVRYPTTDGSGYAKEIRRLLLEDFDSWNRGLADWKKNVDTLFAEDAQVSWGYSNAVSREGYKAVQEELGGNGTLAKLYYDSMLISGDWAAIHFRVVYTDGESGVRTPGDIMQFYHFVEGDGALKVDMMWSSGR